VRRSADTNWKLSARVWWTGLSGRLRDRWSLRTRAIARQRALLESFDAKYEELVDLLCGAAQEGVQPESARQYAALRTWMCAQYRHIRTPMRAFWTTPDAPAAYDPFEALFFPELLEEVIHSPNSIEDMMQARTALDGYRDALEARAKAA